MSLSRLAALIAGAALIVLFILPGRDGRSGATFVADVASSFGDAIRGLLGAVK